MDRGPLWQQKAAPEKSDAAAAVFGFGCNLEHGYHNTYGFTCK